MFLQQVRLQMAGVAVAATPAPDAACNGAQVWAAIDAMDWAIVAIVVHGTGERFVAIPQVDC
jgi:hypothetical protein